MHDDDIYLKSFELISSALDDLENSVPQPILEDFQGKPRYRYKEQSIQQALVLKLVRVKSGLLSLRILMDSGLYFDALTSMRILDELHEDIQFIAGASITKTGPENNHAKFLKELFQPEFDHEDPLEASQNRHRIPRKKIRAYLIRAYGLEKQNWNNVSDTIYKSLSGYVHGAGEHIMGIYDGKRFKIPLSQSDPPMIELRKQCDFYAFRSIVAIALAAKAFEKNALFCSLSLRSKELFPEI